MAATARTGLNVLSVPAGVEFLPAFTAALLAGRVVAGFPDRADPLSLSRARIFVPTRRSARALAVEIARQSDAAVALLPHIVPLGAMEDSETASLFDPGAFGSSPPADGKAVASAEQRRLALTRLIVEWGRQISHAIVKADGDGRFEHHASEEFLVTRAPAQAFFLAGELAGLIDEMTIEGLDWNALSKLAPDEHDQYWNITLAFLKIAMSAWPRHLEENDLVDQAQRQVELAKAEAERFRSSPPQDVQIVAGSTGTNAATAQLIAAIVHLPNGAAVLPGLDTALDDAAWNAIGRNGEVTGEGAARDAAHGHPQAALARLLRTIGAERADVREIGEADEARAARMRFLSEAMRPAETTGTWRTYRSANAGDISAGLEGVALVEAEDERTEALAVAIALREALETPGRTAALVTPDRNLARRVRADLLRWDIRVDDSGGDTLANDPAGIFARLVLAAADRHATGRDIVALLDHPSMRMGLPFSTFRARARLLELAVLRGRVFDFQQDIARVVAQARSAAADHHAHDSLRGIGEEQWQQIAGLLEDLRALLGPLREEGAHRPLSEWLAVHRTAIAALAEVPADEHATQMRDGERTLQQLFETWINAGGEDLPLSGADYAAFFDRLAHETVVRGPQRAHPRVKILGLLEARLMPADLKVLAGLDESVWPPAARTDAFLNRPMRLQVGLSPPERRIGQTAHDFVEAMGAANVILSRAHKRDGAPSVPSRFLQRMAALAGDEWNAVCRRGERWIELARCIDAPGATVRPVSRPMPRPPVELRPAGLSVTRIETWRRDPYAIYAERILRLKPLDPVDASRDAADFGNDLHAVLARFQNKWPAAALPADADAILVDMAREQFAAQLQDPEFLSFAWPRLQASLEAFVDADRHMRASVEALLVEKNGVIEIALVDGSTFRLTATADRIECLKDGTARVVDYKSGNPPTPNTVHAGFAPQLTLEATIVQQGGFKDIPAGTQVIGGRYIQLGRKEGINVIDICAKPKDPPFADLVANHFEGLVTLANQFRDPATPYVPRPYPQFINKYGVYDHLARVKEWSSGSGDDNS